MVNTEGVYGGAGFGDLCLEEPCTIRLCPWGGPMAQQNLGSQKIEVC